MGLNTIKSLIEKRGQSYVDNILSDEIIITEKLDTFRIMFEQKNGELIFYKKDNKPITITERTLNDIWESALVEIPTLIGETKLPEGVMFGVAYTPVERPIRIPYTNLPRYILTDMTKRHELSKKIIETYDYKEIKEWAGILCMGRPPVLFEGRLNEEQRKRLIAYDTKNYDGNFDTFPEMITKTLKSSYSKSDIIEGIVIKSGKNLMQVISYEFDLLNEAYKKSNDNSRDFYDIVLLSITKFMDSYKFSKIKSEKLDEMYIEIISDMFVKFCEINSINEGLEPKYLSSPQYGHEGQLNKKFITNEKAIKLIEEDAIYEALYRVFLSSFRKYKKPYGLLTEKVVSKFNSYVGVIKNMIHDEVEINENFDDYVNTIEKRVAPLNEANSKNITIKQLKRRQLTDVDSMRVIASVQNAFLPRNYNIPQGEKRCAVYLTEMTPFTSAQMTNIEQIHNTWGIPIILAGLSRKKLIAGHNFHISDGLILGQMRALSNFNKTLIPSFMLLDSRSLIEIYERCRPHYEPLLLFVDEGKKSEMSLQLYYEEEIMGGKLNVLDEFNIGEIKNNEEAAAYRAIEDGNGSYFMELTPKPIHNFYDGIINEYRKWEGAVPSQFEPTIYPEIK